jgi:hypothetical protein
LIAIISILPVIVAVKCRGLSIPDAPRGPVSQHDLHEPPGLDVPYLDELRVEEQYEWRVVCRTLRCSLPPDHRCVSRCGSQGITVLINIHPHLYKVMSGQVMNVRVQRTLVAQQKLICIQVKNAKRARLVPALPELPGTWIVAPREPDFYDHEPSGVEDRDARLEKHDVVSVDQPTVPRLVDPEPVRALRDEAEERAERRRRPGTLVDILNDGFEDVEPGAIYLRGRQRLAPLPAGFSYVHPYALCR